MSERKIEAVAVPPFRREVVVGMNRDQYHTACGLNPSSLKQPSPKHIKYAYEEDGDEPTDAMKLGTATHVLVFEPQRFEQAVAVYGGTRRGKVWDEFSLLNCDKTIITDKQLVEAAGVAHALASDPAVRRLVSNGIAETAVFTVEHGLQCRGLIDWINTDLGILCDLKVVNNIEERQFGSAVQRYGWDVSMACYKRWFERESGKAIHEVKFIAVESKPPHDVAIVNVDYAALDAGWEKASAAILKVQACIESGVWPGIADGEEMPLFIPAWAQDEELVEFTQ